MVDRVRDRRRHDRHGRQLAETFGSQRARLMVEFADKQGFKLWNARVGPKHRFEYSNCVVNARCTKTLAAIRRVIFGASSPACASAEDGSSGGFDCTDKRRAAFPPWRVKRSKELLIVWDKKAIGSVPKTFAA